MQAVIMPRKGSKRGKKAKTKRGKPARGAHSQEGDATHAATPGAVVAGELTSHHVRRVCGSRCVWPRLGSCLCRACGHHYATSTAARVPVLAARV